MKTQLKFLELCMYHEKDSRARKINLNEDVIVFEGDSSTGKSSIIKSMFYVLGIEPKKIPLWIKKETRILLKFQINKDIFYIYRFKEYISLFDVNKILIYTISINDQQQWIQFFSSKLNLNVQIQSNIESQKQFFSPTHLFSLFYIDQDSGWQNVLSSFTNTEYLKNWKHHLVSYFVGLANASELEGTDKLAYMRSKVKTMNQQLIKKQQECIDFDKKNPQALFNTNVQDFVEEIHTLEKRSNQLLIQENRIKEELQSKFSELAYLENVLQLFDRIQPKLNNVITQAITTKNNFKCPTCGNHVNNVLKFALDKAQELQNYTDEVENLLNKYSTVKKDIENKEKIISQLKEQTSEISSILSTKKREISLQDIITEEGRKLQSNTLKKQCSDLLHQVESKEAEISILEKSIKNDKNKEEKSNIMKSYKQIMEILAMKLDINFDNKELSNILPSFRSNMGSEGTRAILAYFISILSLSKKCQQSPSLPIIIDTPFFQDPDDKSKDKILSAIEENSNLSSQLILSTSTIKNLFKNAKIYHMGKDDKYSVLKKEEYDTVQKYIEPFKKAHIKELMSLQGQLFEQTVIE